MKGMTMPFSFKNEAMLQQLKAGDVISATLVKEEHKSWLEGVRVVGHETLDDDKPATSTVPHRPVPGETVPDFHFKNQFGKKIRLQELRGNPVLITFIYTRCPLPDFCPRMNANLLAVAKSMPDAHLQLISVSFDPDHDTPAALRAYGQHWTEQLPAEQRANWQFVVPAKDDLKSVLDFFALTAENDGELLNHSLSTTLVGSDGNVAAWYSGNRWTPDEVAQDLARLSPKIRPVATTD
jgi:protein SCO1/2